MSEVVFTKTVKESNSLLFEQDLRATIEKAEAAQRNERAKLGDRWGPALPVEVQYTTYVVGSFCYHSALVLGRV